jgi:hypothetical protein
MTRRAAGTTTVTTKRTMIEHGEYSFFPAKMAADQLKPLVYVSVYSFCASENNNKTLSQPAGFSSLGN